MNIQAQDSTMEDATVDDGFRGEDEVEASSLISNGDHQLIDFLEQSNESAHSSIRLNDHIHSQNLAAAHHQRNGGGDDDDSVIMEDSSMEEDNDHNNFTRTSTSSGKMPIVRDARTVSMGSDDL
eukprot:153163_1